MLITEALVGGRVGNPRGLTAPSTGPGSGLTETATLPPGVDTHFARGGAYSLWLQRFAFLKLQKLQLLHCRAAGVFPDLEHDISITEVNLLICC